MTHEDDFCELEIAVDEFDSTLLAQDANSLEAVNREDAIKCFFQNQLRLISTDFSVEIENGIVRVTWRKSSLRPDALDQAVAALSHRDYVSGVQILEYLVPSRPDDAMVHYNLGMAYSDLGKLDQAIDHLSQALVIENDLVNAKVAIGVAYARKNEPEKSVSILKEAVLEDPDNGYALRNLGAMLLKLGRDQEDCLRYMRRAVLLLPDDQQAWFGLAQAEFVSGDFEKADAALFKTIEIQPYNSLAETAKEMRSRIANQNFRYRAEVEPRMDAVMYLVGAMKTFSEMSNEDVKKVGLEIAALGMNGINVNDPQSQYQLRTLPGTFSGLRLLCYEYVAFKQFAPDLDIGFDLSNEYREAIKIKSLGL